MTLKSLTLATVLVLAASGAALAQKVPTPGTGGATPAPAPSVPPSGGGGGGGGPQGTPSTVPVSPGLVTADFDSVLQIAQRNGEARIETNSSGNRYIVGTYDGITYIIEFYNCDNNGCNDLAFSAGFDLDNADINRINEWNRTKRFGSAYLDSDGDPVLLMPVNLAFGVSPQNLNDSFEWWKAVLTDYAGFIGFR